MLGIIIGISSVIIVLAVGASAQNLILDQIRSIGSNLIVIFPGESDENGPPVSVLGIVVTTLKSDDIKAVTDPSRTSGVIAGTGYARGQGTISYQSQNTDAGFFGVNASYPIVEDAEVEEGRFFSEEEDQGLARVVVLGAQLKEDLFNSENAIGKKIKIKNTFFTVVGVMKKRGPSGFQNPDTYAFVPLKTAQKILLGIDHIAFARLKVSGDDIIDEAMEQVRAVLREEHGLREGDNDDFTIQNTAQALSILSSITDAVKFFLSAVAAISLIVGGVGIMNMMLVSITERTQEIGLRKAIGARSADIVRQFIIESIVISGMGGVIGIIAGYSISLIIALIVQSLGYDWTFIVTAQSLLLAVGFALTIGFVFGIYPAYKASQLNPIEALRYE